MLEDMAEDMVEDMVDYEVVRAAFGALCKQQNDQSYEESRGE